MWKIRIKNENVLFIHSSFWSQVDWFILCVVRFYTKIWKIFCRKRRKLFIDVMWGDIFYHTWKICKQFLPRSILIAKNFVFIKMLVDVTILTQTFIISSLSLKIEWGIIDKASKFWSAYAHKRFSKEECWIQIRSKLTSKHTK